MIRVIRATRARTIAALIGSLAGSLALSIAVPAAASPVLVNAELRIGLQGLIPLTLNGTGMIDVSGGVYSIPAGLLSQSGPLVVPVTTTTAIDSLEAVGLSNLIGSLYVGGATAQAPGEVCVPVPGEACVGGGGIGGAMGIAGLLNVVIIPGVVVFPLDLAVLQLGQGGAGTNPFTFDAAVWTTGTARVNLFSSTPSTQGSTTPNGGLSLVTASYISACGNLLPAFARLTLTPVVPEPSTLAMIGLGFAGVVILFRRS